MQSEDKMKGRQGRERERKRKKSRCTRITRASIEKERGSVYLTEPGHARLAVINQTQLITHSQQQ